MQIDGRTLSHETSETIRMMAVRRVREGERPSAVIQSYGLCRTSIYRWLRAERRGGDKALQARNKHPGRKARLSAKQTLQVRRWISGRDPRQYGFDFGLWTRQIVVELIEQKFGIRLGVTAVGRLLAELDVTPQKPLRRAYERDPVAIEQWQQKVFPRLRARAKRLGAKLFFLDEAGVRSDQVPTHRLNAAAFVELLRRFMRGRKNRVFLVLDGHPAHRAKIVSDYVQRLRGRLELHFLPGYAPELNPDEFVWNHLKRQGVSKKPLRQGESLRSRVQADLDAIRARPALVRSFFRAPSVAYTTD